MSLRLRPIVARLVGVAWSVLGYSSWDDYCTREFGTSRLRLPREERQEVVASLRESGLSIRAIAAATGLDKETVNNVTRELSGNRTPAPVMGTDGKTYKPKPADYFPVEGPLPGDREIAPGSEGFSAIGDELGCRQP